MRKKPVTNVAASIRQRLLNVSQFKRIDYNALLAQYAIERFLYRLSKSDLADRFVLKGAMLFRVWAADLHRPTKDVDFLGFGENTREAVAAAMKQISVTPVFDDGLSFDSDSVVAAEIRKGLDYGGIRVNLLARLGRARISMQVDVGFGDAITPPPRTCVFPALLDQEAPKLKMYPVETVVAEKLEAMIKLGIANSRMKDYYDLLVISQLHEVDEQMLARAIVATFARRKTPLPEHVPTGLSDEFAHDVTVRRRWPAFLRRLRIEDAPSELSEVIPRLRERLWPVLQKARAFEKRR